MCNFGHLSPKSESDFNSTWALKQGPDVELTEAQFEFMRARARLGPNHYPCQALKLYMTLAVGHRKAQLEKY